MSGDHREAVKLEACPWCGRDDSIDVYRPGESGAAQALWQVQCIADDCSAPIIEGRTREEAVAAWNTRTLPPSSTKPDEADAERAIMAAFQNLVPREDWRLKATRAALSAMPTRPDDGELSEGAVLAWMRRTGRTSIVLVEDVDAHIESLTRPAGGEEVEKQAQDLLRQIFFAVGANGSARQVEIDPEAFAPALGLVKAALTKPAALPKEGEEALAERLYTTAQARVKVLAEVSELEADIGDAEKPWAELPIAKKVFWQLMAHDVGQFLFSLPVSGEVERLRQLVRERDETENGWIGNYDLKEAIDAALNPQPQEGE